MNGQVLCVYMYVHMLKCSYSCLIFKKATWYSYVSQRNRSHSIFYCLSNITSSLNITSGSRIRYQKHHRPWSFINLQVFVYVSNLQPNSLWNWYSVSNVFVVSKNVVWGCWHGKFPQLLDKSWHLSPRKKIHLDSVRLLSSIICLNLKTLVLPEKTFIQSISKAFFSLAKWGSLFGNIKHPSSEMPG